MSSGGPLGQYPGVNDSSVTATQGPNMVTATQGPNMVTATQGPNMVLIGGGVGACICSCVVLFMVMNKG